MSHEYDNIKFWGDRKKKEHLAKERSPKPPEEEEDNGTVRS